MSDKKPKLLVILGPTASGKSGLAVEMARRFNGEVISADSRQVYRGLDIGAGKISSLEMCGVPHHLLDVAEVGDYFSVADFKRLADRAIAEIHTRGKLPILAGGTGQYIQAVVDNIVPPETPPNEKLRAELSGLSTEGLLEKLRALDAARAANIDRANPRRLIRAIEVASALGAVPKQATDFPADYSDSPFDTLQIGLELPREELAKRIKDRVETRLKTGWVGEVKNLRARGAEWGIIEELGLGYKVIAEFLQGKRDGSALTEDIATAERQYAVRQRRWFARDPRIEWFSPNDKERTLDRVKSFFNNTHSELATSKLPVV